MQGKLGGGEGIEGLYGSITRSGMQKILDCLAASCHLTKESHIVDVGAGLGRSDCCTSGTCSHSGNIQVYRQAA